MHLCRISHIRQHLDRTSAETLVHDFVSSKIDGLNSMICGLPDFRLGKLQRLQNAAARLVVGFPKYCHITPVLRNLHWLPVRQRIALKHVCLCTSVSITWLLYICLSYVCRGKHIGLACGQETETYWKSQRLRPSTTERMLLLMLGLQFGTGYLHHFMVTISPCLLSSMI